MWGAAGADYMYGDDSDYSDSEGGNDVMYGGEGDDDMYGGAGDDFIAG